MALDAGIYGLVGQGVKSVDDYNAIADQADARKQALKRGSLDVLMGQQKADEYTRGVQRSNALRQLAGTWGADTTDEQRIASLKNQGFASEADALTQTLLKQKDTTSQMALRDSQIAEGASRAKKEDAAAAGMTQTQLFERMNRHIQDLATVQDVPGAQAWIADAVKSGQLPFDKASQISVKLATDPSFFPQWKQGATMGGLTALEQVKAKADAEKQAEAVRQFGVTSGETAAHNRAGEKIAQGQLGVAQAHLGLARDQATKADQAVTYKTDEVTGETVALPNRVAPGQPVTGYRVLGADGQPLKIGGKGGSSKVADAQDVLALLDQAGPLIDKATSSYAGQAMDQTARVFGHSTAGAQSAAQLRALEGALIAKMPKMSGPQSDKDVLLYKQMAGQIGDPTIPADTKRAAMLTIRQINSRAAGLPPDGAQPTASRVGTPPNAAKAPTVSGW